MDNTQTKRSKAAQDFWAAFDHAGSPGNPVPPLDDLQKLVDSIADYCAAKMIDQLTCLAGAMIAKHAGPADEQNQSSSSPQP